MAEGPFRRAKTHTTSRLAFVLLVCIAVITASAPAYAYIDPGSSSFFLQAVVGAIAAGIIVTKAYWRRAFGLLRRILGPKVPR